MCIYTEKQARARAHARSHVLTFLYLCGYVHLSMVPWEAPRFTVPSLSSKCSRSWNEAVKAKGSENDTHYAGLHGWAMVHKRATNMMVNSQQPKWLGKCSKIPCTRTEKTVKVPHCAKFPLFSNYNTHLQPVSGLFQNWEKSIRMVTIITILSIQMQALWWWITHRPLIKTLI